MYDMSPVDSRVMEFLEKNRDECFHSKKIADGIGMNFSPGKISAVVGFTSTLQRLARDGKIDDILESSGEHCWKARSR